MMNYPHNPSGQVASREWLRKICEVCSARHIRLFNDAAYMVLSYASDSVTLAEVAPDFPELSWAEAFTAAKLIGNGTGWHVGAMVGSPDFIGDLKIVKGKTDTGFVAANGCSAWWLPLSTIRPVSHATARCTARDSRGLIELMTAHGMRLALEPAAGFFTLWLIPTSCLRPEDRKRGTLQFSDD